MKKAMLFAVLMSVALGASAAGAHRPVDEHRPLKPDAQVSVTNTAGTIEVQAWDKNELALTGELSEEVTSLDIAGSDAKLSIEVKLPHNTGHVGDTRLKLMVPAGIRLEAHGVSADVTARGLRGPASIETVSGDIRLDGAPPQVELHSVSGDVDAQAAGPAHVETVSGDVGLRGAKDEVHVKTVSGDVRLDAGTLRALTLQTVSGDLDVQADFAAGAESSVETLSGEVTLRLPALPDGEVEMETFSGDLTTDFGPAPGEDAKEYRHEGAGKGRLHLESFSGDIRLKKR